MDKPDFRERFQILSAVVGGVFGDSSAHDDETLARNYAGEYPNPDRIRYLTNLLTEAHDFLPHLDESWEAMAKEANRRLYSKEAARDWLVRMMTVWQEELNRLKNGDSKSS